jgi:hypothetical protein
MATIDSDSYQIARERLRAVASAGMSDVPRDWHGVITAEAQHRTDVAAVLIGIADRLEQLEATNQQNPRAVNDLTPIGRAGVLVAMAENQ